MSRTAFVGATLIDGTGSPPVARSAVVVEDGRIAWVGPASRLDRTSDLQLVDVGGKFVIPGLMDANVHLMFHNDPEVLLSYEPGCYDDLVLEAAQITVKAGLTTVFDTWGPLESLKRVRDRINRGEVIGSRIFCAGNIIGNGGPWSSDFAPDSYRDCLNPVLVERINAQWEHGVGADLPWMSAADVRAAVREYIATGGIDFVKYASSAHRTAKFLTFAPSAQRAIVEEAHAAGMTAQACALTPEALNVAIEAGVDLLQHGDVTYLKPIAAETLDLIVQRQLPCVAMIMTDRHIAWVKENMNAQQGGFKSGTAAAVYGQRTLVKDNNDRRLIQAGAKLMLASDGGIVSPNAATSTWLGGFIGAPDVQFHLGSAHLLWLRAANERGMAPMDALLSATRNIAQAYHRDDELGTIEVGKRADLLVLDGDPLRDVASYGRIVHVVKDGIIVDRDRLPERPILTA